MLPRDDNLLKYLKLFLCLPKFNKEMSQHHSKRLPHQSLLLVIKVSINLFRIKMLNLLQE
jgi:hypothetical protein